MTNTLVADLKKLTHFRPKRNHTSNWKKRQRRRPNQAWNPGSQPPTQQTPNQPRGTSSTPTQQGTSSSPIQQGTSSTPRGRQHKRSARRARAQEAGKLQRWYRANRKRCIRSILSEDNCPRCEILLEDLEVHFSTTPPTMNNQTPAPANLPQPEHNFEPDDLTLPVVPDEVRTQLKQPPTQSSPGPDGVPYSVWKSSEHTPELLLFKSEDTQELEGEQYDPDFQEWR